jgi:hypothetical protein
MIAALLAAGHLYVTLGKLLFLLPATEKTCTVSDVRYGPASRKWEKGANAASGDCKFQQFVEPGALFPIWGEAGEGSDDIEVVYRVPGEPKAKLVTLKPEPLEPKAEAKLTASARKVKNSVRVEVKNAGEAAVLVGDVIAARNKPTDDCVGGGPSAAIPPGESLVDLRPGLLSEHMKAYVAVFTGEKYCRWVEVPTAHH